MLPDKLYSAAVAHNMFREGDLGVVGVSGGADSVALLHGLSSVSSKLGITLHVAHLDHQLRSASRDDSEYVSDLAKELGCPCTIGRRDVRELAVRKRLSIEEAGRLARYRFFAEVVNEVRGTGVVVAHTSSDQVETVVLHWLRGSGTCGLQGLRPVTCLSLREDDAMPARTVRVLRPLLNVSREEVQDYCGSLGLQVREDATNRDLSFVRNKVRWRLLPELRRFNPGFDKAMLRAAHIAANDDECLEARVRELWPTVVTEQGLFLVYNLEQWEGLATSLQYRLLRNGLAMLQGNLLDISMAHLDAGVRVVNGNCAGAAVHLPRGLRIVRRYVDFVLYREREASSAAARLSLEGERLNIPGETFVAGGTFRVFATARHKGAPSSLAVDGLHVGLDAEAVGPEALVRRRRPGDRIQPSGMLQEKKLQDFFVDSKVQRDVRDSVPLVVGAGGRIAWIVGCRVAEWAKVTPETEQVLDLTFDRLNSIE